MVLMIVALKRKVVEIVGIGYLVDLVIQLIRAGEACPLTRYYVVGVSAAGDFASPVPYRGIGFSSVSISSTAHWRISRGCEC